MDHNPFLKVLTRELTSGAWEMKTKSQKCTENRKRGLVFLKPQQVIRDKIKWWLLNNVYLKQILALT